MLNEARKALWVTTNKFDDEIAGLILAARDDLIHSAGIPVEGVNLTVSWSGDTPTVTDSSTISDELVKRAIITYVRAHFGNPPDADRQKSAYDEMKSQLQRATGYGIPDDEGEDDGE
ncbi:MAG: DNA-packaging protein [Firmicutes bacterium]|nr:DNA-packaging protein [Bacillota bacterium]